MKNVFKIGCLCLLGLGGLLIVALLFLAWRAEPLLSTTEALATVPEAERAALQQITTLAKMEPAALRNINGYDGAIFDDARNQSSIVIKNGHIVGLCMRKASFIALPDPGELTALEALDWRECSLTQWPDFSKLRALKQLKLSGQPLPDPEPGRLPAQITLLHLAGTAISGTAPFAGLPALLELDLSGTAVTTFEPLIGLRLKRLNLAKSRVDTLPATVPTTGEWDVDLDGTPLLNPSGYSAAWPFGKWVNATVNKEDVATGTLSKTEVNVTGSAAPTDKPRAIALPRGIDPGVPNVILEVTCTSGRAKIWLEEPSDFFPSPWMKQRKVRGFGVFRSCGYVSRELAPDQPAKLRGKLRLTTRSRIYEMPSGQRNESMRPPDWCDYSFYLEPLDGSTVTGVQFKLSSAP